MDEGGMAGISHPGSIEIMIRDMEKNAKRLAFLNKKTMTWTAAVTALAVSVSMTCYAGKTKDQEEAELVQAASVEQEKTLRRAVYAAAGISPEETSKKDGKEASKAEKEETVYGFLHADGSVDHLLVSNWLKNFQKEDSLTVGSELTDVTNVNGKESFSEKDGAITWDAQGKDIYYQGNTEKELPVSMKVTYYLDDKEVKPEDLKGKSGKVRIRYEYENLTQQTITVDGKNEKVCTPFAVITGMILPTDTFSNIRTEHAEIISDGSSQIVVGCAFPGLQKSLGVSDEDLKELSEDFTIPDYFEVTADAENFSMGMTLSMVTSQLFADNKEEIEDALDHLDDLGDDMEELQDGSTKLVDGTKELYDGTVDLNDGAKELDDGAGDLKDGSKELRDGAKKLDDGAGELKSGTKELTDGASDLKAGASELNQGASDLKDGTKALKDGLDTLKEKSGDLTKGIDSLTTGVTNYTEGVASLKDGADALVAGYEGEKGAAAGAKALADGAKKLSDSVSSFSLDAKSLDIEVGLDTENLVDASKVKDECSKAAEAYLKENNIDPATKEGQAIIKAFTAGSTAGTNAVSTALTASIATQKEALADNVSGQIKKQIGEKLSATMKELGTAAGQLSEGASSLSAGVEKLYAGTKQLSEGIEKLDENSTALQEGAKTLGNGWSQYAEGVVSADKGAKTLYAGTKTLSAGTASLFDGTLSLYEGAKKLGEGTVTLKDGTKELYGGTKELWTGAGDLKDGTRKLYDGTVDLKDGAKELRDGMKELDEDGIQKLSELFEGDMKTYADRMRCLLRAAKDYDNFAGSADGMENSVKFILKTAEISNEEE